MCYVYSNDRMMCVYLTDVLVAWCTRSASPQHSPSLCTQSKGCGKVLHLGRGQCLGKDVSNHVICGAVDESDQALLNDLADPMVLYVDVVCTWVVLVVTGERNGRLVVREQCGGGGDIAKDLRNKAAKPKGLLASVCGCNVLAFSGGQGDNLLSL